MRRLLHVLQRLLLLPLALGAIATSGAQASAADTAWKPNADDALLFEVRLGQYRLGDGVRGYQLPQGTCLDFGDTILALDIPVRLDKQSRRATGWAFNERHTIVIDRERGEEQIMNSRRKVAPDDIIDAPEGWCVRTEVLARWLGVELNPDVSNALLIVKSDHKLPPELTLERRSRVPIQQVSFDLASLPSSSAPWRGVKMPAVDVVASAGVVRDKASGNRVDAQYELYATGEAGPVAYDARLSSNRTGVPESLRVRAYRADPTGHLLGPLRATQVAVGDIQGFMTPLVSQISVGRGAMITNRPIERPNSFDKTSFIGELPRGWDAELYRNGQLLAFANDRADGRYTFDDIPLQYGQNRFDIVLYGPQGQIRHESRSVPVGLDSIPPRKTYYWASIDQDGHDLLDLNALPTYRVGGWRGTLGIERGLDARTSFAVTLQSLIAQTGQRMYYAEASVRRAIGAALMEFSAAQEMHGGRALRAQMLAELGQTYIAAETIWVSGGFISDRLTNDVTGQHQLSIDRTFGRGRSVVPVHLEARYTTRRGGLSSLDVAMRASAMIGPVSLTGDIAAHREHALFGPSPPSTIDSGLLLNGRIGKIRLRGEARYRIAPSAQFESATLVGEWNANADLLNPALWRAELGYDAQLHRARAGMGYVRTFDRFALNANAEIASDGSVAAGLSVAFSIGPNPTGGIRMTSAKLASHGSALVRVYRDSNANGHHDAGEPWEKGVQISAGRVPVEKLTDGEGGVIVDDLEPYQPVLVGVDASSLPDPMVQPSTPGLVIMPRPGVATVINLPLVSAGDVDGTLVHDGGGTLQGVDLELVDIEGRVVARTRSDFDGFFLFEGVPYGHYSIRIARLSADAVGVLTALSASTIVDGAHPSAHLGSVAARPNEQRSAAK